MTLLVWLAASSLVWGAVLWGAAIALQSGNDLSGRARQWIWRGAAVLLILPWLAVPVVGALAPDLSGSVAPPEEFSMAPVLADAPVTVAAMNVAAADLVERAEPAIVIPWIEIIVAAVVFGWLLRVVAAGHAMRHLGRIVSQSRPGKGASLAVVARWSRLLGLKRAPELRVVSASTSPFSTGVRKPLVCLPEGIEQNMHAQTLDLVVGHECIHVARGDGWRRPLERSIADIMWFNPFAWAIRRELDLARELACDEAVVAASSQRRAYARTLRIVAGMASALPTSAPAASMSLSGGGRLLAMRMKRTLDAAARKPAKAAIAGAVMLAFAATPMAIAQAILIEAVQPPEPPSPPPAPPAPPEPAAIAEVAQAPLPPAAPSVAVPAQAPTPPVAPKAPGFVQMSSGGDVLVGVASRVVEIGGSREKGYRVRLLQTSKNAEGETCGARLDGLSGVVVAKDQVLAKGAVIGERGTAGGLGIAVRCSGETDSSGWPVGGSEPPAPPAPPPPVHAVAPVPAVSPVSTPSAITPPAPVARPRPRPTSEAAPPAPVATPAPSAPTPRVPAVPVTARPETTPTPAVTPTPERIVLRAPFAARVFDVQMLPDGAAAVKLQQVNSREWPITGESCMAFYPYVENPRAISGNAAIVAGTVIGFGRSDEQGNAIACSTVGPMPIRQVIAPVSPPSEYSITNAPHPILEQPARRTSAFGNRTDPFGKQMSFHSGLDIASAQGSAIHSPGEAVVARAENVDGYGNLVELKMVDGYLIRMGQLEEISVQTGDRVKAGDVVGTMGSSGPSTGPHLHLEVLANGAPVDPELVRGLTIIGG